MWLGERARNRSLFVCVFIWRDHCVLLILVLMIQLVYVSVQYLGMTTFNFGNVFIHDISSRDVA